MYIQGHPGGHEVHSGPIHALAARRHRLAQRQVAGLPVHGQQGHRLQRPQPLQDEQEEDLQRTHGRGLRLRDRLLPRHEVPFVTYIPTEGITAHPQMTRPFISSPSY